MFDNSYLTSSAVESVRKYLSDKVPLSQSIADIASRDNLNPDQIKRVIETVNQVAYLKLQQEATDQTFEFPLATIEDVSALVARPTGETTLDKQAEANFDFLSGGSLTKQASDGTDLISRMSEEERSNQIFRAKLRAEKQLEKLAHDERELIVDLANHLGACRRDPDMLEKIAYLTEDEEAVSNVSKMLTGMVKQASTTRQMFYEEDLSGAKKLLGLVKQAFELQHTKSAVEQSIEQANAHLTAQSGSSMRKTIKDTINRAKPMMPGKLSIGMTAPFFESKNPVWGSLQKSPE